jgi:hypothetical protein
VKEREREREGERNVKVHVLDFWLLGEVFVVLFLGKKKRVFI